MATSANAPAESIPFELQSLSQAFRYQQWLKSATTPYLGQRILELGSGIGNLSQHLPIREKLILSDIEPNFIEILKRKFCHDGDEKVSVLRLESLRDPALSSAHLDTIISFNVLEHVEDDAALLREAIHLLRESKAHGPKRIVTLVPAHQWAFGLIDKSFGHFRRYTDNSFREALARAGAAPLSKENYHSRYMNVAALFGWWLNGKILKKDSIGSSSINTFEMICPLVRPVDDFLHKVLRLPFGNSLIAIYKVQDA